MLLNKQKLIKLDLGLDTDKTRQMTFQQYEEEFKQFVGKYGETFWIPAFLAPDYGWFKIDAFDYHE